MPRVYPAGTDMAGKPLLTIADRMERLGLRDRILR